VGLNLCDIRVNSNSPHALLLNTKLYLKKIYYALNYKFFKNAVSSIDLDKNNIFHLQGIAHVLVFY
jgi:hypothetical protein